MRYFVDTGYWIARLSRNDQWHLRALDLSRAFTPADRFVTSDFVLLELLNYFSTAGPFHRSNAATLVDWIEANPAHRILRISQECFREARTMYERHSDKSWSLTDCSSFVLMKDLAIVDVLTFDHHYIQAGFRTPISKG